ncbi:DEAD/DEAH box helicase family protein [Jeotgalicoccus sp. ATCC 8456]|uniref:DEAD/DEAH box helicase family protein n=1 Tax=Jeotgalicoccus sp. ATCC 8456 TaxID=946435 RepID=UPI0018E64D1B|nr:DEAD/DEAH box helicase family protein [Jeotgalicoccus sp. ATCC 8456]QQD86028.1 DEAD/DEAH box helicase family protein [Jeotgalicoccus sp. ATCC 8456]
MILKHGGEKILFEAGVKNHTCCRCGNQNKSLFYTYYSHYDQCSVTYCMHCIILGRSDSVTPLYGMETKRFKEEIDYHLDFQLNDIQIQASDRIVSAIHNHSNLLLYAVTGAGKTEITFEGIKIARRKGLNVAFVSPRIDVVKEVYLRLTDAFKHTRIDLMYSEVKNVLSHAFTVCTVHQLMNYIQHYDVIIVDEVDAFPLADEPLLMSIILRALSANGSLILMTATPTREMIKLTGKDNVVTIARRYHGHDLAIPKVYYHAVDTYIEKHKTSPVLDQLVGKIIAQDRKVLIFLPEIKMLEQLGQLMKDKFPDLQAVYSGDRYRYEKVQLMRDNKIKVLLTTTILERGVTFPNLDVIVVNAHRFDSAGLIQICGRVGRKPKDPLGNIWFLSESNTRSIHQTIKKIKAFNKGRAKL